MNIYGCIGKKLTHSFSKDIHSRLADYDYELIELAEEEIEPFFEEKSFNAINVTIPYKQTVIPYLDCLSETAKKIGAVNTIVNKDGKLYGYNTDYYGMKSLIEKVGVELSGKKVLVLGTGGTSKTGRVVAEDMGATEIITVSRSVREDCITYEEAVTCHKDAGIIINTTPSGMYPDCDLIPIDISLFNSLEAVIDAVYNPLCTNLVLEAKKRKIKAEGGLYMLVMQAVAAVEKFLDMEISDAVADKVYSEVLLSKQNIVLSDIPQSAKSTAEAFRTAVGFETVDTDYEIEKRCGMTKNELIDTKGEEYFRKLETEVIREVSSRNTCVISVGKGGLLKEENVHLLKRNGKIFVCESEHNLDKKADVVVPYTDETEIIDYIISKRMELV